MNFCGSCGEKLEENALVCGKCGSPQKAIAKKDIGTDLGFKRPGEYDGEEAPQVYEGIKVESSAQQPLWGSARIETERSSQPVFGEAAELLTVREEEAAYEPDIKGEVEAKPDEDRSCPNCSGALIFSLARDVWFCPACGTDVPGLPSPYGEDEEEDAGEEESPAEGMPPGMPAGPLPPGAGRPSKFDKPPDEVDGVTKDQAKESIIEIQNMIEAKARAGLYSIEAETSFDTMKTAFMEFNYPAVIEMNKRTKEIIARAEKAEDIDEKARAEKAHAMGGTRQQAVNALQSSRGLILEAEKLGYDVTESKKIYKQAEPAFRAGDFESAVRFAHDVEESVNAVLGGKRLARAPSYQPRYSGPDAGAYGQETAQEKSPSWFSRNQEMILKYILPIGGLIVLIIGASISYISYVDNIWNPFSDGPDDWGPYNTVGVILGIVAVVVGLLFAILPFFITKKVYVRMELPRPVQMK